MNEAIATVSKLRGKYFRMLDGKQQEIQENDVIYENDTISGHPSNSPIASVNITMNDTNEVITIKGTKKQLFSNAK
ncbi:hypothetical protein JHD48_10395 [Sulfurimonas sp. SAG-AH-194-I05]|nr:hypothetical protein [Sulfurimonas sp. SAG-AH-194-I05]MDF1876141.1 hypothetical protein [Sulfurimonas sp. SAG-AH-194-I05]